MLYIFREICKMMRTKQGRITTESVQKSVGSSFLSILLPGCIFVVLFLAACSAPSNGSEDEEDATSARLEVDVEREEHELQGETADVESGLYVLSGHENVRPQLKEQALNGNRVDPELSFPVTIAVFQGQQSTLGYGVHVDRVEKKSNRLDVFATYISPDPDSMVGQALTSPAAFLPVDLDEDEYTIHLHVRNATGSPDELSPEEHPDEWTTVEQISIQ